MHKTICWLLATFHNSDQVRFNAKALNSIPIFITLYRSRKTDQNYIMIVFCFFFHCVRKGDSPFVPGTIYSFSLDFWRYDVDKLVFCCGCRHWCCPVIDGVLFPLPTSSSEIKWFSIRNLEEHKCRECIRKDVNYQQIHEAIECVYVCACMHYCFWWKNKIKIIR